MDIPKTKLPQGMSNLFDNVCLIIPVLNPGPEFFKILKKLTESCQAHIIIVNDGSKLAFSTIFAKAARLPKTTLLNHEKNQGKGAALKSAFTFFLNNLQKDYLGVICLDGDGQHLPNDVLTIAKRLQEAPQGQLLLGSRSFSKAVPFRSKFGNQTIRFFFNHLHRIDLADTQTGLRGIPNDLVKIFFKIPYNRYEFETACLLAAKQQGYTIKEIKITTVYENNNNSSHFRPIQDSCKIIKVLLTSCWCCEK